MKRVQGYGRGHKVFAARDFVDLGARAAVDQTLSRLAKAGVLRRVGRGLYDWPRHSAVLKRDAPADIGAVVDAVARRANVTSAPDNLAAANAFGLTNAVPSRPVYAVARPIAPKDAQGLRISFKAVGSKLAPLLDTDAAPIIQALVWARSAGQDLDAVAQSLGAKASADAKASLAKNLNRLPIWALRPARAIAANRGRG